MLPTSGEQENIGHSEAADLKRRNTIQVYVLLSLLASVMLFVIAWNGSLRPSHPSFIEKNIVYLVFVTSCALGIYQSRKGGLLRDSSEKTDASQPTRATRPGYVAHHPNCGSFDDRILLIRGKRTCGGCLGMLLGSAAAAALMAVYLLLSSEWANEGVLVVLTGMIIVAFCLVEIAMKHGTPWSHVIANSLLMIGFFFVTIGMIGSTGEGAYGLLAIVICFLWLDTRIQLSDWRHARTCDSCGRNCGFY
jgi:hypothetical protein